MTENFYDQNLSLKNFFWLKRASGFVSETKQVIQKLHFGSLNFQPSLEMETLNFQSPGKI